MITFRDNFDFKLKGKTSKKKKGIKQIIVMRDASKSLMTDEESPSSYVVTHN